MELGLALETYSLSQIYGLDLNSHLPYSLDNLGKEETKYLLKNAKLVHGYADATLMITRPGKHVSYQLDTLKTFSILFKGIFFGHDPTAINVYLAKKMCFYSAVADQIWYVAYHFSLVCTA